MIIRAVIFALFVSLTISTAFAMNDLSRGEKLINAGCQVLADGSDAMAVACRERGILSVAMPDHELALQTCETRWVIAMQTSSEFDSNDAALTVGCLSEIAKVSENPAMLAVRNLCDNLTQTRSGRYTPELSDLAIACYWRGMSEIAPRIH